MEKVTIKFKKLNDKAQIPTQGSTFAAGYDLYALLDAPIDIAPSDTVLVKTGLALEIPEGYWGGIFARSGLAIHQGLRPANCVGVIDSDYRGEVAVAVHNDCATAARTIEPNERIAQFILIPQVGIDFIENELSETERADGGFGSTGK